MSKYYTPSIEEFHVGFEFYIKDKKHILSSNPKDLIPLFSLGGPTKLLPGCKVKYLDREDIKSLGFEFEGGKLIRNRGDNYNYKEYSLYHRGIDNRVIIGKYGSTVFIGDIKNKSELKKLLIQLNIK